MGYKDLRSISRLTKSLEEFGLIERVKKTRKNGSQMSNGYQVLINDKGVDAVGVLFHAKGVSTKKETPLVLHRTTPPCPTTAKGSNIPVEDTTIAKRKKRIAKKVPLKTPPKRAKKKPKPKRKQYQSVSDPKDIVDVIDLFIEKKINTTVAGRWYGDNTQRKAIDELIQKKGLQKLKASVSFLPVINQQGYFANVTTPNQLLHAWDKIANSVAKEREIQLSKNKRQITKVVL